MIREEKEALGRASNFSKLVKTLQAVQLRGAEAPALLENDGLSDKIDHVECTIQALAVKIGHRLTFIESDRIAFLDSHGWGSKPDGLAVLGYFDVSVNAGINAAQHLASMRILVIGGKYDPG
jgi:hypothetical protein